MYCYIKHATMYILTRTVVVFFVFLNTLKNTVVLARVYVVKLDILIDIH